MNQQQHDPRTEITEFQMEWHHLQMARTALRFTVVLCIVAAFIYVLRTYFIH